MASVWKLHLFKELDSMQVVEEFLRVGKWVVFVQYFEVSVLDGPWLGLIIIMRIYHGWQILKVDLTMI